MRSLVFSSLLVFQILGPTYPRRLHQKSSFLHPRKYLRTNSDVANTDVANLDVEPSGNRIPIYSRLDWVKANHMPPGWEIHVPPGWDILDVGATRKARELRPQRSLQHATGANAVQRCARGADGKIRCDYSLPRNTRRNQGSGMSESNYGTFNLDDLPTNNIVTDNKGATLAILDNPTRKARELRFRGSPTNEKSPPNQPPRQEPQSNHTKRVLRTF